MENEQYIFDSTNVEESSIDFLPNDSVPIYDGWHHTYVFNITCSCGEEISFKITPESLEQIRLNAVTGGEPV